MQPHPMYINGLNYIAGTIKPIETLAAADAEKIKLLQAAGVHHYCETESDAFDNAFTTGQKALELSALQAADIDMVIYGIEPIINVENNWVGKYSDAQKDIKWLLKNLSLTKATPFGLGFYNCTSFIAAIDLAAVYMAAGRVSNVLVLFSAVSTEAGLLPRLPDDNSVESDGAAAFILSQQHKAGTAIKIEHHALRSIDIAPAFDENNQMVYSKYVSAKTSTIRNFMIDFFAAAQENKAAMKQFITQNTNMPTMNLYRMLCGFDQQQLFTGNLKRYGHLIGIDGLVNLADLVQDGVLAAGDKACLLGTSGMQAGGVLVKVEHVAAS